MFAALVAAFPVPLALPPIGPQTSHPFSVADLLAMERISDPEVSPDGRAVLFNLRTTDLEANRGRTDVWVARTDGQAAPRRLSTHEASDTNARWMPDGRSFVFLSTRSGSSQVWRLSLEGGEPEQLTKLPLDVSNLAVFPDGKRLLFTLEVYPDLAGPKAIEETAKRDAEREKQKVKGRVYDSLLFRHWDTWEDGKRSHVFAWTIGPDAPVDLTAGFDGDAPPRPFGGGEELAISPDGSEVTFAARPWTRDAAWTTGVDLYAVPAAGGAAPKPITAANKAYDNQPAYSPDGKWLAYLAMSRPGYEADRQEVVLLDRASGARRVLGKEWDRSAGEIVWSPDSKTIYTTADDVGNHLLFAIDVASGAVTKLVEQGYCASPRVAEGGLVFLRDDLRSPVEVHRLALAAGAKPEKITDVNAARVAAARTGEFEQFSFAGAKNETVHGYLVRPAGFVEGRKYPVAFLIHGGPQGSFGNHFHYRWNPQVYAGAGYAAVMIDFHGSTGYGQAFCDAIREDWGGAPYEDLIKGLDFALAKYPFLDPDHVAALGASYGGYMINWIAGQTDRFECLVNHDGNLDERLAYFDTEELWFPEWDHGGLPWEKPENYAKHNPIEFVKNWKTPMLVIHGGLDFRVVDTQGMSTFTALQRKGIPSRFLHFPDENHWVLKPQNSELWHETVLGWLDRWCKPDGAAASAGKSTR